MGNQQAGSCPNSAANSTVQLATSFKMKKNIWICQTNLAAVVRKSARNSRHRMAELWEMRRRSVGIAALDAIKREEVGNNAMIQNSIKQCTGFLAQQLPLLHIRPKSCPFK